jgi:transposase
VRDLDVLEWRIYLQFEQRRVSCANCGGVRVESLDWLAKNPRYTRRFAQQVGKYCREMSNTAVAAMMFLQERTVKDLDKLYMQELLKKNPAPAPRVIGIDELSIKKGHTYRIIVSDIVRGCPIWIGGEGRKEADLDRFFQVFGIRKVKKIELAVMDMWKPFRNSVKSNIPTAAILFDKFHILRHLSEAMDKVRRSEYKRVTQQDRAFIKGQRYNLLSNRANLNPESRQTLKKLLAANKRLNTAYILKEQFAQLWDYQSEAWARRFFDNWKAQLKWQRLKPFEKFAEMIDRHWHGIASYFQPGNKVKLGFVEGLNNKIRVIQRRAYGYHDEEYLKLKILTAFIP